MAQRRSWMLNLAQRVLAEPSADLYVRGGRGHPVDQPLRTAAVLLGFFGPICGGGHACKPSLDLPAL